MLPSHMEVTLKTGKLIYDLIETPLRFNQSEVSNEEKWCELTAIFFNIMSHLSNDKNVKLVCKYAEFGIRMFHFTTLINNSNDSTKDPVRQASYNQKCLKSFISIIRSIMEIGTLHYEDEKNKEQLALLRTGGLGIELGAHIYSDICSTKAINPI